MNPLTDEELLKQCERIHEPKYFNYELYRQLLTRFRKLTQPEQVSGEPVGVEFAISLLDEYRTRRADIQMTDECFNDFKTALNGKIDKR